MRSNWVFRFANTIELAMVPPVTIRNGEPDDLTALQQLFVETVTAVCSGDYDAQQIGAWISGVNDQDRWSDMIASQYVLLAHREKEILGFASLDKGHHVDFLYVHKNYQGRGLARRLFTEIEREAIRQGHHVLTAEVSKTARPFFEKLGFELEQEQIVVRQEVLLTNFKMKKILNV